MDCSRASPAHFNDRNGTHWRMRCPLRLQPAILLREHRLPIPLRPNHRKRAGSGPFDDPRLPHFSIVMDNGRLAWPVAEANGVTIDVFYHRLSIRWPAEKAATYPAPPRKRKSPPQRPSLELSTYLADGLGLAGCGIKRRERDCILFSAQARDDA